MLEKLKEKEIFVYNFLKENKEKRYRLKELIEILNINKSTLYHILRFLYVADLIEKQEDLFYKYKK